MFFSRLYRYLLRRRFSTRTVTGERVLIVTRSMSDELYERSQSLITLPYPRRRVVGFNHWKNANDYLHLLFEYDVDWVINIDEDCFVFDDSRMQGLLEYMERENFAFCGVPDGGACVHRFHNPVVTNPFFNIYHVKRIRPVLRAVEVPTLNRMKHDTDLEPFTPHHLLKEGHAWAYDNFECFYGLFFWLLRNGFKPLYLPSAELEDGITTEVCDHTGTPMLYHTWFTRQYGRDETHTKRIDDCFNRATALQANTK